MSNQHVKNCILSDWQVAPAEYQISNYDDYKVAYRFKVEEYIKSIPLKSFKKKKFVTISTNVLCADTRSSSPDLSPLERDIYLPLEIVLTKWSLTESCKPTAERNLESHYWMINPGRPTSNCFAMEHKRLHKIDYSLLSNSDPHIDSDLKTVIRDLNSKIGDDRIIFSLSLKYCRQDLGCLKWLIRETGIKIKPIQLYSLEDFYVVALRRLNPELSEHIGQGFARHRLEISSNTYDTDMQCDYHQLTAKEDDGSECGCCAKAMAEGYTHILLDDITTYTTLFEDSNLPKSKGVELKSADDENLGIPAR